MADQRQEVFSFIEPKPPLRRYFMQNKLKKGTKLFHQNQQCGQNDQPLTSNYQSNKFDETDNAEDRELVQVYLRVKPCKTPSPVYGVMHDKNLITSLDTSIGYGQKQQQATSKMYSFSHIFGSQSNQKEIFDHVVKPNLKKLPQGHNFTLVTFGASGSGKTYTLMGTVDDPGLTPRSLEYIFSVIDGAQTPLYKPNGHGAQMLCALQQNQELRLLSALKQYPEGIPLKEKYRRMSIQLKNNQLKQAASDLDLTKTTKHYVWVSFIEVYNEAVYDLLGSNDKKTAPRLRIREDANGTAYVENALQVFVRSGADAYDVLVAGKMNLQVAATGVHARSSRSHCIFTITIVTDSVEGGVRVSQLRLCDLAGCERAAQTQNAGARLAESRAINSSLHVLARCVRAARLRRPAPVRESRLTRLLAAALTGAQPLAMLVCISPAHRYLGETKQVLSVADLAKDIPIDQTMQMTMLCSSTESLQDSVPSMQQIAEYEQMRISYERLKEKHEQLNDKYEELCVDFDDLRDENLELRANIELISYEKNDLEKQVEKLQECVNTERREGLDLVKDIEELYEEQLKDLKEKYETKLRTITATFKRKSKDSHEETMEQTYVEESDHSNRASGTFQMDETLNERTFVTEKIRQSQLSNQSFRDANEKFSEKSFNICTNRDDNDDSNKSHITENERVEPDCCIIEKDNSNIIDITVISSDESDIEENDGILEPTFTAEEIRHSLLHRQSIMIKQVSNDDGYVHMSSCSNDDSCVHVSCCSNESMERNSKGDTVKSMSPIVAQKSIEPQEPENRIFTSVTRGIRSIRGYNSLAEFEKIESATDRNIKTVTEPKRSSFFDENMRDKMYKVKKIYFDNIDVNISSNAIKDGSDVMNVTKENDLNKSSTVSRISTIEFSNDNILNTTKSDLEIEENAISSNDNVTVSQSRNSRDVFDESIRKSIEAITEECDVIKDDDKIHTNTKVSKQSILTEIQNIENDTLDQFENIYKDVTAPRATEFEILISQTSQTEETQVKVESHDPVTEKTKCETNDKPRRTLRLRKDKKVPNVTEEQKQLKDMSCLQKDFSDITLDIPTKKKEVKDVPSPDENSPPKNVDPLLSSVVTRSRRKLFTPRAETMEESPNTGNTGDGTERVRAPRPSYHPRRARRKL